MPHPFPDCGGQKCRRIPLTGSRRRRQPGGGPGSLVDGMFPSFPGMALPIAQAHKYALEIFRQEQELNWAVFSPAADIQPGERTGKYRLGTDQLVSNEQGESRISAEDFAVAMLD